MIIYAALALGGLGLAAAVGLGLAAKIFYVKVDPIVEQIGEALPGANCGGCGQAGCSQAAEAIAMGRMAPNGCVASSPEGHAEVAAILGVEVAATEPMVARVGCSYSTERADRRFSYDGAEDCRAAFLLGGGPKQCRVGCLGLGTCVQACPFNALYIGTEGLPVVDESACTGCGTCTRVCPVGIMNLTSVTERILGEYAQTDCTAPCQRRCPAGIDVPEQIRQTTLNNYGRALQIVMERNPLPLICGRICPNACELSCRRNLIDAPVAINPLKRFVADNMRKKGKRPTLFKAPSTGRKVAVVGGGVEGLSAAFFLARLGHSPTVFEAQDKLGGLLRAAIPENRLPRDVLDWEIENILTTGVVAKTGHTLGTDFDLTTLFEEGYEAVLLAVGGWDALLMRDRVPTSKPAFDGLHLLLPLAMQWSLGRGPELDGTVALVGGSRDLLSAAKEARRHGAQTAVVIWTRSSQDLALSDDELSRAKDEGVEIHFDSRVHGLVGRSGRLTGLLCRSSSGEELNVEVDTVISTTGRVPSLIVTPGSDDDDSGSWSAVSPHRPGHRLDDFFENEEPVSDYRAAVEAIGAGRRGAALMHRLIQELPLESTERPLLLPPPQNDVDSLESIEEVGARVRVPQASLSDQVDSTVEKALTISEEAAIREADRCLRCGLICYQRTAGE